MRILVIYMITLIIMFVIINIATNFFSSKRKKINDFCKNQCNFVEKEKSDNNCIKKIN